MITKINTKKLLSMLMLSTSFFSTINTNVVTAGKSGESLLSSLSNSFDLNKDSEERSQSERSSYCENSNNENESSERQTMKRRINDLTELKEGELGFLGDDCELFAVSYVVKDANTGIVIDKQATIQDGDLEVNFFDVPKKAYYDLPTIVNDGGKKIVTAFRAIERHEILEKKIWQIYILLKEKT